MHEGVPIDALGVFGTEIGFQSYTVLVVYKGALRRVEKCFKLPAADVIQPLPFLQLHHQRQPAAVLVLVDGVAMQSPPADLTSCAQLLRVCCDAAAPPAQPRAGRSLLPFTPRHTFSISAVTSAFHTR